MTSFPMKKVYSFVIKKEVEIIFYDRIIMLDYIYNYLAPCYSRYS